MSSPVTAEIDALVAALGGVQPPDLPTFGTAPLLAEFLAASGLALDEAFLHLTSRYGGGYFSDTVEFNVRERVPIARAGNRMALGRLLGWHRGTMSIPRVDVELGDQLPLDLLPFADVGQGDLLCLAVPVEWDPARSDDDGPVPHDRADELRTRPGAIWYWHHESPEGDDLYLVADDLLGFLRGLARRTPGRADTSGYVGPEIDPHDPFWASLASPAPPLPEPTTAGRNRRSRDAGLS
jgi:hypothetical protein